MKRVISWLKLAVNQRDYLTEENEAFLKYQRECNSIYKLNNLLCSLGIGRKVTTIHVESVWDYPNRVRRRIKADNEK